MPSFKVFIIAIMLIVTGLLSFGMFETNENGFFQVKQAALTGKMSVQFEPGIYLQNFGTIFTYKNVVSVG